MSASDYINQFWELDKEHHFNYHETWLYFYLLGQWYESGQTDTFVPKLLPKLLPKMLLKRSRDTLVKIGLIVYHKGDRRLISASYGIRLVTNVVTNHVTNNVTNPKEEISPTPPKEENIYNNKEISSNEDMKKVKLSSPPPKKQVSINYPLVVQSFNEMLSPPLPRCMCITDKRKAAIKARVDEHGIESVITVFQKVHDSSFLTGRNDRNWKCDFDWIFKPTNYIKILEGNYDNGINQTHYSEKRAANEEVFRQFVAEREQRASGMVVEVEKPF